MTTKYFLFILGAILLLQCSNPKQSEGVNSKEKSQIDSGFAKTKTDTISEISPKSEITCPKCGYKKIETLPTDVCRIKYTCENCNADLFPKTGDCCVFCSYGTNKCPSKQ
jgi:hypothetical protein